MQHMWCDFSDIVQDAEKISLLRPGAVKHQL